MTSSPAIVFCTVCHMYSLFTFTFTFMHLADAFIQSDLHCIQVTVSTFFLSALAFPGNRTHDLGVANAMLYQLSYRKALSLSAARDSHVINAGK